MPASVADNPRMDTDITVDDNDLRTVMATEQGRRLMAKIMSPLFTTAPDNGSVSRWLGERAVALRWHRRCEAVCFDQLQIMTKEQHQQKYRDE